jgi:3-phosphoshikimate 1-carboxyvinyltransferase
MASLHIRPLDKTLRGSVPVPSDKSIAHRALLLGALATGRSEIKTALLGEDNASTLGALRAMGVQCTNADAGTLALQGVGLRGLSAPDQALDCGNSGTTMRLLLGILSAQSFPSELIGDASLTKRPMARVASMLRARGARIYTTLRGEKETAPLRIKPAQLTGVELESDVASAQVKSAVLLSGLYVDGPTLYREPTVSRDHTERMLLQLGVPLRTLGPVVSLDPSGWNASLPAFKMTVPGDLSAAAFVLAAAAMQEGARVDVREVGINPTRTGVLEVLRDMGAHLEITPEGDDAGEPTGRILVMGQQLRACTLGGERLIRAIDEVPVVCALAARASGVTRIMDASELRTKESDRLAAMADVLRAFGVGVEETEDGLTIEGKGSAPLNAARVNSRGDHRIAMSATLLALFADGDCVVDEADCIATSFPRFSGTLRALGADLRLQE